MFNPAMMGISPQQMAQAQEVGQHLRMEITTYKREGRLEVKYLLVNPDEPVDVGKFVEQLRNQFAKEISESKEILMEDVSRKSIPVQLAENICALFTPIL